MYFNCLLSSNLQYSSRGLLTWCREELAQQLCASAKACGFPIKQPWSLRSTLRKGISNKSGRKDLSHCKSAVDAAAVTCHLSRPALCIDPYSIAATCLRRRIGPRMVKVGPRLLLVSILKFEVWDTCGTADDSVCVSRIRITSSPYFSK